MAIFSFVMGFALVACANALFVSQFENVAPGLWDTWNASNPENVNQGRFALEYGNGKLYFISRRLHRENVEDPWDAASRGGIVSTFHFTNQAWTHTQYNRLDEDQYGEKLFTLNGRLFMLTYSTKQRKVIYHKLFFWNDEIRQWSALIFDIDASASTTSTNAIQSLTINVPNQSAKFAYCVTSAHANAQRGSEMVFSKFNVDFRGTIPVKASLKPVARHESLEPASVVFTAVKGDTLYALVHNFYSEGYVPETQLAYTVDLKTNLVSNVTLNGAPPPMDFDEERMFQTPNEIFIVGGSQMYGLGQARQVRDIWALDLSTFEWRGTNALIPDSSDFYLQSIAYDQQDRKLFLAGLKDGLSVAQVST